MEKRRFLPFRNRHSNGEMEIFLEYISPESTFLKKSTLNIIQLFPGDFRSSYEHELLSWPQQQTQL